MSKGAARRIVLSWLMVSALAPSAFADPAQTSSFNPGHGAAAPELVMVREVTLGALPNATAADVAARPRIRIGPLTGSSPSVYAARKAAATAGKAPAPIDQQPSAALLRPPVAKSPSEAPARKKFCVFVA